jgi:spore germination protein
VKTKKYAKFNEITPLQLFFLIFLSQLGAGLLTLPRDVTAVAGQDGWISVFLATILTALAAAVAVKLASRFEGLGLIEINQKVFGKFLGSVLSVIYFSYFLLNGANLLIVSAGLITVWVLPGFPLIYVRALYLLALVYLTRNGIKVIARLFTLYFYHIVPLFFILAWPAWNLEPRLIFPVGTVGLLPVLKGMEAPLYGFLGFETVLLLNPFLKEPQKSMLPVQAATLLVGLLYTATVFILTGFFGVGELQFQLWPTIFVARTIEVAFVERLDIFVDIIWVIITFTTLAMNYYLAALSLARIFNQKEHKGFILYLVPPIYLLANLVYNATQAFVFAKYLSRTGAVLAYILPAVIYLIALVRKVKGGGKLAK